MFGKGVMYFFNGVGGYWKGNFGDVGMLLIEWIKSYNLVGFLFWVFLVMSLMFYVIDGVRIDDICWMFF